MMRALSYQDWTKEQRLRWLFAWIASGLVLLIADFVVYQTIVHMFPYLLSQIAIIVALAISAAAAALFGFEFHERVLMGMLPDRTDNNRPGEGLKSGPLP